MFNQSWFDVLLISSWFSGLLRQSEDISGNGIVKLLEMPRTTSYEFIRTYIKMQTFAKEFQMQLYIKFIMFLVQSELCTVWTKVVQEM